MRHILSEMKLAESNELMSTTSTLITVESIELKLRLKVVYNEKIFPNGFD